MFGRSSGLDALLERPRPSTLQQFIREPCIFLVTKLYKWRRTMGFEPINPIAVVCISDTHNSQPSDIPAGEILIHAGDITQTGTLKEIHASLDWLNSLPHPFKVLIAGNHDILLDHTQPHADPAARASINWGNIIYLDSESTTISCANGRRLKIYGSPLTPRHGNWAFQYPRNQDVWQTKIPADTDILITHGPPKGHLDAGHLGCKYLLDEVWRKKPRLHVFGHVHDGYGVDWVQFDGLQRAYENAVIAGGGLWNLGRVLFEFIVAHFTPGKESKALFVNPTIVGGLRDEQRRRPITVYV
ncbi:Metallo-dependent phosphatase [Trematosphaeria pertusa]|uniref:Metallo-dependent phosphatase n=1 Tax=Trematosphaeria pertusa TaxID=390896 RepID=A0A6A6J4K0_9PLEO|nr:Metallo-dependent phosphatase [Trematosphaeria pertusa]KAF2257361.1 Metallo-dependent phosphatase [Trematosphaeria pertusa]